MRITETHYTIGAPPVSGAGVVVSADDLEVALTGPVSALVFDDVGSETLARLLEGLGETDFERGNLDTLLGSGQVPENWRVGEAMAEVLLSETCACCFPWPDGRDERKRKSSLPGADLVGFQTEGLVERFAFGEVKTSAEAKYPPGAVHGRHGLKQQLEDLRDRREIRDDLVKYLGHRATGASWSSRYRAACAVYLRNPAEVRIFGVLVRDVEPHVDDLRARVQTLGRDCPAGMVLELWAVYLPEGSISTLGEKVAACRRKGGDR